MSRKDIGDEELFDNFDPSLSQYTELASEPKDSSPPLFDEIVTVEERYCESRVVNQGGMKKIYRTLDSLTNRPVAKATLINCDDEEKAENFLREARLTAALEHPNIIPVYDIGVDETEGPFFIMKLIGGKNLSDIIKNHSSDYTEHDFMGIFLKVCDAIAYAHSKGIVHLDLKPENIQVGDYGEVLVCDWGLAKIIEDPENITDFEADLDPLLYNDMTMDGVIKGTPGFMAPEQVNTDLGPKDQRTDIYALGGILYSLLTLKNPHKTDTVENILINTLEGKIEMPSRRSDKPVSSSLEAVAMKALETEPEARYQTVGELRKEINNWLGGFATEAENAGFFKSAWLLLNRHKAVSLLLFLLLLSGIFGVLKIKQNENIALENEKKAKDALKELTKQKEFAELVSANTIGQLEINYNNYLKNFEFREALTFIDKTVKLYPNNEQLNAFKGEVHFYLREFREAQKAFEKAGSFKLQEPYGTMVGLLPKYIKIQKENELSAQDLIDITYSFAGKYRENFLGYMTSRISSVEDYTRMYNDPDLRKLIDRHIEFCRLMVVESIKERLAKKKIPREEIKQKLKFSYTLDEDGINLDLSDNKMIDDLVPIRHLPLKSLNLKNTGYWRRWVFDHYSLKFINIVDTKFRKLKREDLVNQLQEIILTKEQYEAGDKGTNYILRRLKFTVR